MGYKQDRHRHLSKYTEMIHAVLLYCGGLCLVILQTLKAEGLLETSIGVTSSRLTRGKTGVIKAVSITI